MAQERPDTPEKQLLKLIEDPKSKGAGAYTKAARRQSTGLFSPGAWMGRASFFKKGFMKRLKTGGLPLFNIKSVNRILVFCNFALIGYFAFGLSDSISGLKEPVNITLGGKQIQKSEAAKVESFLKPESFYLEKIGARNIFKMGKIEKEDMIEAAVVDVTPSASAAVEATQHLRLVGISWSNNPDAMVEDTRALRTFFVKKGQMVGEVKVKDILRDRIVLVYEGDEVELR